MLAQQQTCNGLTSRACWDGPVTSQQTRDIEPMLGQCWADAVDAGPIWTQHWFNSTCLLGIHYEPHTL